MTSDRSPEAMVREYYRALDNHEYDRLQSLLAPGFVQVRPDTRLEGRERFVIFMRDERPVTDTSHPIDAIYERKDSDGDREEYAARGRLVTADGKYLTGFVDVFSVENGQITELRTYTD